MTRRNALTLLELVVSMASSIVLVAGLAGSLYISTQALNGSTNARQSLAASTVLRDLMADVSEAESITNRTDHAIEFTVPDRNEDGALEAVRYAWSGVAGDPLTYQYNGGPIVNIATNVQAFNLTALTRELVPPSSTSPVATGVEFKGFTEKAVTYAAQLVIDKPSDTTAGDLLIACVVTKGNLTMVNPSGWTLRHVGWGRANGMTAVTFGVWWKIANASEPSSYNFAWTPTSPGKQAYGWVMRFTGHDAANPINTSAIAEGTSTSLKPPSPAVTTTASNPMILRLGGFDANRITIDSPGLEIPSPHTPITMDYSSNSPAGCSGGAGYFPTQPTAGDSGSSTFALKVLEEYVTVTIAIAPETSE